MISGRSYSDLGQKLQSLGQITAEIIAEIICILSQLSNADRSLLFSACRVLQLCRSLTKHCIMAIAYENLIKHLKLAVEKIKET